MHRINAKTNITNTDFIKDGIYVKHYPNDNKKEIPHGISCFVPTSNPHNVPNIKYHGEGNDCFILHQNEFFHEKLALVYTGKINLNVPSVKQKAFHFHIIPTERMTQSEFKLAIKSLPWLPCTIKANASSDKLIRTDDDIEGLGDSRIIALYDIMAFWYEQETDAMGRLRANDIRIWIAEDKPSFDDLLQDETRARYVFSALARIEIPSACVSTIIYRDDILNELEVAFGWKVIDFCTDPKVFQQIDVKVEGPEVAHQSSELIDEFIGEFGKVSTPEKSEATNIGLVVRIIKTLNSRNIIYDEIRRGIFVLISLSKDFSSWLKY
nr:10552_t:CDS:2 [Entrophospora candida]